MYQKEQARRAVAMSEREHKLRREAESERARAITAENIAKTEASKHQQVATFLKEMLKGVQPSVALGRDTAMLREILDKTAERVGQDLKDQPEVQAELYVTIGVTYDELGFFVQAEAIQREALRITGRRA